ncbi:MAG: hypothetical protein COB02_12570 [Candidatus Cloacimonadota bacterium]|nr:MAG: hypothetical protein COB02_12570 [Candidatus Cloacimonadota bacterium]
MKNYPFIYIFVFALFLNTSVFSQKLHFSASYQEYNQKLGLIVLKDQASIVGADFQIEADNLQYNLVTGDTYARGNVKLFKEEDVVRADSLKYNIRTQEGSMEDFKTITLNTFISGQSAIMLPQKMKLSGAHATTCDHMHHHYHITAKEMILIPNKKLFLKKASFYLGNRKILTVPAYKFDLTGGRADAPLVIIPGYDQSRGIYTKIKWDYYFNEDFYGEVKVTPSSRQKVDYEVSAEINDTKRSPSQVTISRNNDDFTGNTSNRVAFVQSYSHETAGDANLRVNYLVDSSRFFSDNKELDYFLDYRKSLDKGFVARLEVQGREDPDKNSYLQDSLVQSLGKKPSIFLDSPTRRISGGPFQYRYQLGYTKYKEQSFTKTVDSAVKDIVLHGYHDTINTLGGKLRTNTMFKKSYYSGGSDRDYFRLNTSLNHKLGKDFSSFFQYNWHDVDGINPFVSFDKLNDRELLTHRLAYHSKRISSTLFQSTFDLKRSSFGSLSSNIRYRGVSQIRPWSINFRAAYQNGRKKSSLSGLKLSSLFTNYSVRRPDIWELDFRAQYSNLNSRWESFTQSTEYILNRKNRIEMYSHYNSVTNELTRLSLGVTKDFHCWEGKLDWDFKQKEISIQFYLKQGSNQGLGLRLNYEEALRITPDLPEINEAV